MIGWQAADGIVERLDPETVPACALCLFELARAMHECRPSREIATLLQTTCDWVWLEIDSEVEARLARLTMRGVPHAEAAARDVRLNGWESRVVRLLVARLARGMADEMDRRDPPTRSLSLLPFGA